MLSAHSIYSQNKTINLLISGAHSLLFTDADYTKEKERRNQQVYCYWTWIPVAITEAIMYIQYY